MKICIICEEKKELTEFHVNRRSADGKSSYCHLCACAKKRAHYYANKELLNAKRKEWRKNNSDKDVATIQRWRASKPEAYELSWRRHNRLRRERVLLKVSPDLKCVRC